MRSGFGAGAGEVKNVCEILVRRHEQNIPVGIHEHKKKYDITNECLRNKILLRGLD
jgi:hypothetical protein